MAQDNLSLCHGLLGNLLCWQFMANVFKDDEISKRIINEQEKCVRNIDRIDYIKCGTPGFRRSPGFMSGLAGIGFGLLSIAKHDAVPNILAFQSYCSK